MKAGSQKLTYTYSDKNPYQLSAMIRVLALMQSKQDKNVRGFHQKTNAITFVTPVVNNVIGTSLRAFANRQQVLVYQMETYYYFDKKGNPVFKFKYKLRNKTIETIELNTINNKESIVQFKKGYIFYKKR